MKSKSRFVLSVLPMLSACRRVVGSDPTQKETVKSPTGQDRICRYFDPLADAVERDRSVHDTVPVGRGKPAILRTILR